MFDAAYRITLNTKLIYHPLRAVTLPLCLPLSSNSIRSLIVLSFSADGCGNVLPDGEQSGKPVKEALVPEGGDQAAARSGCEGLDYCSLPEHNRSRPRRSGPHA